MIDAGNLVLSLDNIAILRLRYPIRLRIFLSHACLLYFLGFRCRILLLVKTSALPSYPNLILHDRVKIFLKLPRQDRSWIKSMSLKEEIKLGEHIKSQKNG